MMRVFQYLVSQKIEASPRLIIDSLVDQVGIEGTLLFPLFNFDFPQSRKFSMIATPSQMGAVTEFARLNYAGHRTGHPIYSFFAIGAQSEEFKDMKNKSGYGLDSPFAKVLELEGKIASVDLDDQNSMTMYHFVEEKMNVSYRYFKTFHGEYQNLSGETTQEEFLLFVRDLESGVRTDVNRMGEILWREKLYSGNRPGVGNGMRTIKAKDFVERTRREIVEGRALETLYSIQK